MSYELVKHACHINREPMRTVKTPEKYRKSRKELAKDYCGAPKYIKMLI